MNVIKRPIVNIKALDIGEIGYNEEKTVIFEIVTNTRINNATLKIGDLSKTEINEIGGKYAVSLTAKGKMLLGKMPIELRYKDEAGKYYFLNENYKVNVINIPWYRRFF